MFRWTFNTGLVDVQCDLYSPLVDVELRVFIIIKATQTAA